MSRVLEVGRWSMTTILHRNQDDNGPPRHHRAGLRLF
jgi:hypothetical protein